MSVNPWFLLLALAIGYVMGRRSVWAQRSADTLEGIRKLEAGEYGERLKAEWEKRKKENGL